MNYVPNYLTKKNIENKILDVCLTGDIDVLPDVIAAVIKIKGYGYILQTPHINRYVAYASMNNHTNIIKWFSDQKYGFHTDSVVYYACKFNHVDVINLLFVIDNPMRGILIDTIWEKACKWGRLNILELMVKKKLLYNHNKMYISIFYEIGYGDKGRQEDDGDGGGIKFDILSLVIGCGIIDKYSQSNQLLEGACRNNNKHMIKYAIDNGADDWNKGLREACINNDIETVKLMIQHGANDWNRGLEYACMNLWENDKVKGISLELIDILVEHGASDWNNSLISACNHNNIDAVKLMIQYGANNFNKGLYYACCHDNLDIFNLMIKHGANNWNECFGECYERNNINLMNLLIHKGATDIYLLYHVDEFKLACYYCRYKNINPSVDKKCNNLLATYPVYVLLCSKLSDNTCSIKKLPQELFRLLHQYF